MPNRELIATRDFSYRTRRLRAGDCFPCTERDARILTAIGRARDSRIPGKIKPPPPEVQKQIGTTTPTADERFAGFLDRSIPTIAGELAGLSEAELRAYLKAEEGGKSRKGLIAAMEAEIDARG